MAGLIDDITLINKALRRIGAGQIFALDEETELAEQATSVYFDRVESIIGTFRFSWARKTFPLDRLDLTPNNGWKFAYAMPGTALVPVPVKVLEDPRNPDYPLREFLAEAGELYADSEPLWASFIIRPAPSVWPAVFREAMLILVAAALAVPITHDKDLAAALLQIGQGSPSEGGRGGLIGQALAIDAAGSQSSAPIWGSDPLTSAHLS